MRGSPPLEFLLVALGFGVLAVPLVRLTGQAKAESVTVAAKESHAATPAWLRLRWAHAPRQVTVRQGKAVLAELTAPAASPAEISAEVRLDREAPDLQLSATWPEGTPPTALSLEIEPDGHEAQTVTRWTEEGRANLDEYLINLRWP